MRPQYSRGAHAPSRVSGGASPPDASVAHLAEQSKPDAQTGGEAPQAAGGARALPGKTPEIFPPGSVAIIGMAGRFPGAANVEAFWANLKDGVESVTFFSDQELAEAGVDPETLANPNYIKARSVLDGIEWFDADFFGYSPREAEAMDPQQRLFLEGAWEALEHAGYDPDAYRGAIGLYAGVYMNTYLLANLCSSREFIESLLSFKRIGAFQTFLGNDKDYLTTRIAYKLNLRGPAITVQTACSTSLMSVCLAWQSLVNHQCDMALAGGITVTCPQRKGYLYQEGGMMSPDGHCRAFDAQAQGTVFGSGMGIVVLKRLEDALADRDTIYAVIRGAALNNDGSLKVSYTAPSVDGQAEVVTLAQALAGVDAETISYVEAHGTGTPLGDPIEIAALTQAFRATTQATGFCGIGSVKSNLGHLDVAAGVAGLIKTTLALRHQLIPPSLHFATPNPKIDFANSPFYVVNRLTEWKASETPRRAGVSSFGVGGTNAHVVLEEAPVLEVPPQDRPWQLLVLSARMPGALEAATTRLTEHLQKNPELNFGDVAFTLAAGRRAFNHRRILVCRDARDAIDALAKGDPKRVVTRSQNQRDRPVVFMFPGQGAQCVNMGAELYRAEPVFREHLDHCAEILKPYLRRDLREVLYPSEGKADTAAGELGQTQITQPALFAVEYALARLWMSWGVQPQAMIGHSVGEYVAGCLAGVFSVEDALRLVAERARLVQARPGGAMVAVRLREEEVRAYLNDRLSVAAINAPALCIVSGPFDAVEEFERRIKAKGLASRRLDTSHAFHSPMMDAVIEPFTELVQRIKLGEPAIPCVSTVTANWITAAEATDPAYWGAHLRRTVRFADALALLLKDPRHVLLEVGPGQTLAGLARQHPGKSPDQTVLASLPASIEKAAELPTILNALGGLWLSGVNVDWLSFYEHNRPRHVALPTYPFDRKRYWIEQPKHPGVVKEPTPSPLPGGEVEIAARNEAPLLGGAGGGFPNAQPASSIAEACGAPTLSIDSTQKETMESFMPQPQVNERPSRKDRVLATLKDLLRELSGVDLADKDASATFLELGFDSLFLTQARQSLQSKFGVKITYRQLSEDLSSLNALAAHIDASLPPEAFPLEPTPAASDPQTSPSGPTPATVPTNRPPVASGVGLPDLPNAQPLSVGSSNLLERLFNQQLQTMSQLMAQQLATLQGSVKGEGRVQNALASHEPTPAPLPGGEHVPRASKESPLLGGAGGGFASACPAPGASVKTGPGRVEPKGFGPFRPVSKSADGGLTPKQQRHLAEFTERFTRRTLKSKRLAQDFRQPLADPRSVAGFRKLWKELVYQIAVEKSSGSKLWDVDGNEYVDVTMGFGVNLFGHLPPFVVEAVEEQLQKGVHIGPQSPLAGEVAELMREFTGQERVTFCNTGSEAVMAALRIARTVTGRSKIVFFSGDYHGMFDEVLLRAHHVNGTFRSMPVAPGIPANVGEEVLILDYGAPESLDVIRSHAQELAAILVEPVQSRHPDLQPKEFLHELRKLATAAGIVLVFDEVITGFRVHPGGTQAVFGVPADLATYGKVIGGGLPIGALVGKAAFMDTLDGGAWQFGDDSSPEADMTFFAGTFVRHPLALAAARAVLRHLKQAGPGLQEDLNRKTSAMAGELNGLFGQRQLPIHVEHFGSLFRFHFPAELQYINLLFYHVLERGIYIRETHQNCFLSTAHTTEDIARVVRAIRESVDELQEAEFLPSGKDGFHSVPDSRDVKEKENRDAVERVPTRMESGASQYPLTEAQKEIWVACQLSQEVSCAYNESFTARFRGEFKADIMRRALHALISRHDALRSTFSPEGDQQRVAVEVKIEIPLIDLSELNPAERDARVAAIPAAEANQPFDLAQGPLVRVRFFKLEPQLHLLVFTAHHLVCDGWSSNVVLTELSALYSASCEGRGVPLPPPGSFAEYVRLEAESQKSREGQEAEAWWREQFATPVAPLELPTDHPRAAVPSKRGGTRRRSIDSDLYQALKQVGSQNRSTLFSTLLAAFKVFVHRLTGQEELVVGVFSAGQARVSQPDLVGHCVNMLPVRSRLEGNPPFKEYLAALKTIMLDVQEREDFTYGRLLQQLTLPREPGRLPLVEVAFNLEPKECNLKFTGLETEVDQNPQGFVNLDLFLNINDTGAGLILDMEFNSSLFGPYTIDRWLGHFETLLRSIVAQPGERIGLLPLLTEKERNHLLVELNNTDADFPADACLHTLFEERAEAVPEASAILSETESRTYREINQRANQLARHLQTLGVGPDTCVGICVERSAEMVIGMLGILKAGGAYVPLDPAYPKERLAFMIRDTQMAVLLTQGKLLDVLPEFVTEFESKQTSAPHPDPLPIRWGEGRERGALPNADSSRKDLSAPSVENGDRGLRPVRILCLDTDGQSIATESAENPVGRVRPENLAYVIYTSGTTGQPKGVLVEHRSIVNHLFWRQQTLPLTHTDRFLHKASFSFDISVWEIFAPLLAGAQLVLAKPGGEQDSAYLVKLMAGLGVTHAHFGPAMLGLILDEPEFHRCEALRRVFCG
ncbi:MAG: aminotransferase class III-fold pyridoxal phosphate-dependent enzyme, partial [Verrucomicrobia bacterium]|nr:aminotransferase class III-fold pyridoxal phosphate-dependent enzyme [Verrucomicrobiota bacterium]